MPALDHWEKRLQPYFTQKLRLIAEIPMVRADVEDIASEVRAAIQRRGLPAVTRSLQGEYPLTFLVFLSAFAARNNEQNYWQALADLIGVPSSHLLFNYRWHRIFRDEAIQRGLRTFDWEEAANRYVATIRFHGGIPAYSLPDFFERILLPSVQRADYRGVDSARALQALLKSAYFVDSPVITFLENSGELGVEFFDACRKMARRYLEHDGELLSHAELELPPYVVDAFSQFMEREEDRRFHLRKPGLFLALYDEHSYLWVRLPEQEIPLRYAQGVLQWELIIEGLTGVLVHKGHLVRRRQNTLLEEILLNVDAVPQRIQAALVFLPENGDGRQVLRRWNLPLFPPPGYAPLLAFRAVNGQQVRPGGNFPAEALILVHPLDTELEFDGPQRCLQEYGQMGGAWQGWQMQVWDLNDVWSLRLLRDGQPLGPPIPVMGRIPEPELTGGQLSPYGQDAGATPLYIGEPPMLRFPIRQSADSASELKKWRLKAHSVWETEPEIQLDTTLEPFLPKLTWNDDWVELPLKAILGAQPIGTFAVQVIGPGDVDADIRLRLWPKLTVVMPSSQFPKAEENNAPIRFTLRIPEGSRCEAQAGSGDVVIRESIAGWEITAGADVFKAQLNLLAAVNAKMIRVPIEIPLPRLRWGLAQEHSSDAMQWATSLMQQSISAFLQAGSQSLHLEMKGLGGLRERLRIQLVDFEETDAVLQESELQNTPFSPDWLRVSLSQFTDTIRQAVQQGRLDLVYNQIYPQPTIRFPLVVYSRELGIKDVRLEQVTPITWRISWQEENPLKNRRLLLNPSWQPWQDPWEYRISDSASGEYFLENASLPLTRYQLAFYIAPTWEPQRSTIPVNASVQIIDLVNPSQRLEELQTVVGSPEQKFKALVECACIYEDLGDTENRDLILSQCTPLFIHLTNLRLILSLLKWLETDQINTPYKRFFYRQLYKHDLVEKLFKIYRPSDPHLQEYLHYTTQVSDMFAASAFHIASVAEEPAVVHACLKHLLNHENELLFLLVLDMIENARLSNADAVDLLAAKPEWALEKLAEWPSTNTVNHLLAGLLPMIGKQTKEFTTEIAELMERALPFTEIELRNVFLHALISFRPVETTKLLLKLSEEGIINEDEILALLMQNPKTSYEMLRNLEQTERTKKWLEILCDQYPQVLKLIQVGSTIDTPVGIGIVEKIIHSISSTRINKVSIEDPTIIILIKISDAKESFHVQLDNSKKELTFVRYPFAVKCGHCDFIHPSQWVVERHQKERHRFLNRVFKRFDSPSPYVLDDIEIIDLKIQPKDDYDYEVL